MHTVYLDTCVISGIVKQDLKAEDLIAITKILEEHKSKKLQLLTSEITKEELERIPAAFQTLHKTIYNLLNDIIIAQTFQTNSNLTLLGVGGGASEDPLFTKIKNLLPSEDDARHIFQASKNAVSIFLTTDYKTILRYAEQIKDITGVVALSPSQLNSNILSKKNIDNSS
jgi:hypothetical protein